MLAPDAEDIRNAATSTLTNINQVEHLQHRSVPRIRNTTAFCGINFDAEAARIRHRNAVTLFDDDQPLSAVVIGIHQTVGQCFTQSLMHWGIIYTSTTVHLEGHLDILDQLVVDPEIEVVHIAAPVSGGGDDTVSPTGISVILFLIVQKVSVEFPHNIVFVAEHEKSGRSGMLFPIRADAHGTQLQEEIFILQGFPHMAGTGEAHPLAIAADALLIEHCQVHLVQNQHILRLYRCIAHHGLIFFLGAAVVTLSVAAIGAERVTIYINRLIRALCTGNIDDHNMVAIHLLDKYVLGGQHINAGLIGVIDDVPELLNESVRVGQIYRVQGFIRPFFHSQQDNTAVGIGKGGIGFPNAFGQTAKGLLRLNAVVLPILLDFGKVNHAAPPSPIR